MEDRIVLSDKRKSQRIQSSLKLLLDACRYWAESFENIELMDKIAEMECFLTQLNLSGCSDDSVEELEEVTINLIGNMDQFLKSMGEEGIDFKSIIH